MSSDTPTLLGDLPLNDAGNGNNGASRLQEGDRVVTRRNPRHGPVGTIAKSTYILDMQMCAVVVWDDGKRFTHSVSDLALESDREKIVPPAPYVPPSTAERREPPGPEPEPLYDTQSVFIITLETLISGWENFVTCLSKGGFGKADEEEYSHDLMQREEVHGCLNAFHHAGIVIPANLKHRLKDTDERFLALTEDSRCVWHDGERYDKDVFWYYFRWPKQNH